MKRPWRYLILLIFILIVNIGMFFIYSNVSSPEKIVYFKSRPTFKEKIFCIVRGGAIETIEQSALGDELRNLIYLCHYH